MLAVELQEKNEVAESCNIWYNKKGIEIFVAKKQNAIKKRMFFNSVSLPYNFLKRYQLFIIIYMYSFLEDFLFF